MSTRDRRLSYAASPSGKLSLKYLISLFNHRPPAPGRHSDSYPDPASAKRRFGDAGNHEVNQSDCIRVL
jgi:hypothetical protein